MEMSNANKKRVTDFFAFTEVRPRTGKPVPRSRGDSGVPYPFISFISFGYISVGNFHLLKVRASFQ